jgi:urease accessory protein UreF
MDKDATANYEREMFAALSRAARKRRDAARRTGRKFLHLVPRVNSGTSRLSRDERQQPQPPAIMFTPVRAAVLAEQN